MFALVAATVIIGFLAALTIPPWQHYDEPAHFETAKLIADRMRLPSAEDFDPDVRRQVFGSMIEFAFFRDAAPQPNLVNTAVPNLGHSQIDSQSLYYIVIAAPIRLMRAYDVTVQLYAARLASVLLFIPVIIAAYLTAKDAFGDDSPLRWILPLFILLTPAFTENMSAVNNDAGAAAVGSMLVAAATRINQHGLNRRRVFVTILLSAAAMFTKLTILPIVFFVLVILCLRSYALIRLVMTIAAGVILAATALFIDARGAAEWISKDHAPARVPSPGAPDGDFVFRIDRSSTVNSYLQRIPLPQKLTQESASFTIGAWIWKTGPPEEMSLPVVQNLKTREVREMHVRVDSTPRFYTQTITINGDWRRIAILLIAPRGSGQMYYDGVAFSPGSVIDDAQNFILNGSAEAQALRTPLIFNMLEDVLRFNPTLAVGVLQSDTLRDLYLRWASHTILDSFWAQFGWGQITLESGWNQALRIFTTITLGMAAFAVFFVTRKERRFWFSIWVTFVVMWSLILLRGINTAIEAKDWMPSARYASSGILISWIVLLSGWRAVSRIVPRILVYCSAAILGGALLLLGIKSVSVLSAYYPASPAASLASVRNSQSAWRTAATALTSNDVDQVIQSLDEYARIRPGNPYAQIAVVDMLASACQEPHDAACRIAAQRWRAAGGSTSDAMLRAASARRAENADASVTHKVGGWIHIAGLVVSRESPTFACDKWLLTLSAIPTQSAPASIDAEVLRPAQTVHGSALRGTEPAALCSKSLSVGTNGWATFYSRSAAALIAHIPTAGDYRISADMAATFPPANGRILIDGREIGRFSITSDDKQLQQHSWDISFTTGWHRIEFTFDNDLFTTTTDRNLFIAAVRLDHAR